MPDSPDTLNARVGHTTGAPRADHQSPAAVVCRVFGSARQVALHLDLAPSTTWRWLRNGYVPSEYHLPLLEIAQRIGVILTPEDLVRGRAA